MLGNQGTLAVGVSSIMLGGLWFSGLFGAAAGTACTATSQNPPVHGASHGDTAYATLAGDLALDVDDPADPDDGVRHFTILPEDEAADSGLDFEWQFGSSFGFHGVRQSYAFAATGTYTVLVRAHAPDGSVAFVMETEVDVDLPQAQNLPPLASARAMRQGGTEAQFILNGAGSSDPEGAQLTYSWRQTAGMPQVTLSKANEAVASFVAPAVVQAVTLEFTLTVSDGENDAAAVARVTLSPATPTKDPDAEDPDGGLDVTTDGATDAGGGGAPGGGGMPVPGGGGSAETGDPVEPGEMVNDTPIDWNTFALPPCAVLATNATSAQSYAWQTAQQSMTVLFDRSLSFSQQLFFPPTANAVNVFGVGSRPTLNFTMTFNGNYGDPANLSNGVSINSRVAALRNLEVAGFQLTGSALKGESFELMSAANCSFRDNGTTWYTPSLDDTQTIYTQVIGAHQVSTGHIDVRNCSFLRGATNLERWGRVLYISARSVSVLDNTFQQTGNPFGIGFKVVGSANQICGNTVSSPALCQNVTGGAIPPVMAQTGSADLTIFTQNNCSGAFSFAWSGNPNPLMHYIGDNNYAGLTVQDSTQFAVNNGVGYWTLPQWQGLGFDRPVDQGIPFSSTLVRSEAELRTAAARTATQDLVILIDRSFTIADTVSFPASTRVVRLVGLGNQPTLTFNMNFDNNWSAPASQRQRAGLSFGSKRVFIRNLAFAGYHLGGGLLRADTAEDFEVSKCAFRDVGTQAYTPRIAQPASASDVIGSKCIETGALTNAMVHINNSSFTRCSTNQATWGACLDLAGRNVMVADNNFQDCGNIIFCRNSVSNAVHEVLGNVITRPAQTAQPDGTRVPPWLCSLPAGQQFTFAYNSVAGVFKQPWQGLPDTTKQLAVENNYSGAAYQDSWAVDAAGTGTLTWTQWRALGLD